MTTKTSPVRIRPAPKYIIYGNDTGNFGPEPDKRLPKAAKRFWRILGLGTATHGYAAYADGKLVGFIRVYKDNGPDSAPYFNAAGTWVAKKYRRQGIAERLWAIALRADPIYEDIHATVCTAEGRRLINKLIKTHQEPFRWRPDYACTFPEGMFL
jgi:GNAT superfamily N-acetyltransferase